MAIDPIESNTLLFQEWSLAYRYHMPLSRYRKELSPFERRLNALAYALLQHKERYAAMTDEQRRKDWP